MRILFCVMLFVSSIAAAQNRQVDISALSPQLQDELKKQFPFLKPAKPTWINSFAFWSFKSNTKLCR